MSGTGGKRCLHVRIRETIAILMSYQIYAHTSLYVHPFRWCVFVDEAGAQVGHSCLQMRH